MRGKAVSTRRVSIQRGLKRGLLFCKMNTCSISSLSLKVRHFPYTWTINLTYHVRYVCVEDKNFNLVILLNANIRFLDYDSLSKRKPLPTMPNYLCKSQPYILEIENSTRKYILAAKSLFDLQEWYKAVYAHIETVSDNQNLIKN